ncbi:short-chain dehydrogenase/reductase family 16C member 6-like [Chrysoperla carnea]|uniref:short-chain dehydrogenase/reductase family 16C member 6-like n=1 Tax=Chrysoperla carnea TaxID=189513 RepID=UPI001D061065|nr:short-chain dehydrogenase/reductase family 16C member 6-like [Chrysoperla carnea]
MVKLITGSANDLGRNLCYQFAKKKCQIICIDKDEPKNNNTVRVIKQFHPECNIKSFICDVSQYEQVQKVFQEILAEFKHVDILINNVAINICKEFIEDYTETQIKDILNTNVLSHFWTTKEILLSMEKRDIGYIVGISSIAGIAAIKHINPYCASKFAVTGFMQSLENQLRANKSNIRALSVRPYFMVTQMVNPKMLNHRKTQRLSLSCFFRIERVLDPPAVAQKIVESIENGETRLIMPFYIWGKKCVWK